MAFQSDMRRLTNRPWPLESIRDRLGGAYVNIGDGMGGAYVKNSSDLNTPFWDKMVHDYQTDRGVLGLHGSKCSSWPGPGLGYDISIGLGSTATSIESFVNCMMKRYYVPPDQSRRSITLSRTDEKSDALDGVCGVSGGGVCGGTGSGIGKSEAEERCENNIEGGGQGSIDGDEENESEKEEELESQKEKEDDHQHDDNGSPTGRELISTSQHDPVKTFSIDRIKYAGDDTDSEEGGKTKMDEIWINYCGMPVCFGLQEFAIVTGLRCHHPEGPPLRKRSKARKCKGKVDGLFDIAQRGYKASDLLTDLEDKIIPELYREKLCLVWFAHSVILARDVNKVIEDDLLARAEDFDKFNNYPWGYGNFYLTAWEFEAIPSLRKQLMDYPDEVSHPRIFKWLAAKSNTNIKEADLFNPPDDAIVPTEEESVMTSYISIGHVDTIADPTVELIKKELAGETTIRRAVKQGRPNVEALHDQPFTEADSGASSGGVVGVDGRHTDAATTRDDENVDAQERINMFEKTPFRPYTKAISKVIKEFKSKRCVIPSKKVRELHTSTALVRRKKRAIRDILFAQKSKEIAIPPSPKAVEVQWPVKKVDIYVKLGTKEKRDLRQDKNAKPGAPDYPRPPFLPKTSIRGQGKQLTYQEAYHTADRIMDLDFCKKLKDRYDKINGKASALGIGIDFLVPMLVLDEEETLRYVRGDRPNPHGKSWTEAKRILAVISMNDMHYRTVEILIEKKNINVYDSNVSLIDDFDLFLLVEPLMVLLSILLRESKLMNHLPKEVLIKKSWDFEGRNRGMILPKDDVAKTSGSHTLGHIKCLLTGTKMAEPMTFLCDNAVVNLQEVWAYGVLNGRWKPVYIEEPVK
ncbi:hypothetical protein FXO37_04159 [Capsicum annuum]|nr:hypothetical protein FXO37_04159 [Capsicum annuum]